VNRFEPRDTLRNGHWMTLYSWGNPRYFPSLPPPTRRYFDVALDARVVAACHWQERPWEHPTLLALHGLNGSSEAHYMKGLASKAFARGMNVLRLNQRNCGNTEHLAAGLFHSGLTTDAAHVSTS
jgi:Predicted hydrolase of the alpha/beta-hydrolase fold